MAYSESAKKRKPNWNDDEVKALLRVWKNYHTKLSTAKRNHFIYEDMAKQMELYGCFRDAPDVRCKIKNLTKMFKTEKTQELVEGSPSKWRFYSKINDILGEHSSFSMEYLIDQSKRREEALAGHVKVESGQATILRLGCRQKNNETSEDDVSEPEQSYVFNESTGNSFSSKDAGERNWEGKGTEENFIEELYQEYRETKQSLMDTDQKILELLSNQNDLIKTQNDLCKTQNAILTSLLEKMK